ncbi:iron ABC transporter permease [Candidatus Saganbacteria bacterium]|nr:iron ABC transporter permease [Candidatus Saganbacteria bacterium]
MRKRTAIYFVLAGLVVASIISLFLGPVFVPPQYILKSEILWQIRIPRVLLSALVGMMLGLSGVMLQGILRNPLADPYILGVSSGAGVGAATALALKLNFVFLGMSSVPILAFIFAIIAVLVVYRLSYVSDRSSPEALILGGVAVSAFASAILALIIIVSGQLQSIYFWLLGSLSMASYVDVATLIPYLSIGLVVAYFHSKELNVLLLGEDMALTMGVEVSKIRFLMIVTATLMTAAAVSVSGLIGFVGLIVPHFVRLTIGPNHRSLIPMSALGGALLMVVADSIGRTVFTPVEMPIGIVMALVGAPFFLYILKKRRLGKK